jgi:hypothetical protein
MNQSQWNGLANQLLGAYGGQQASQLYANSGSGYLRNIGTAYIPCDAPKPTPSKAKSIREELQENADAWLKDVHLGL